jgi:hypothetical protein
VVEFESDSEFTRKIEPFIIFQSLKLNRNQLITIFKAKFYTSLTKLFVQVGLRTMSGGSLVITAWRVLRLRTEETPSSNGGQMRIY